MFFPKPEYSKSKVNWAGEIIASAQPARENLLLARPIIDNWRACHSYPINTFNATLRIRLKKIDPRAIVAQRLKRFPSIIEKLQRFPDMCLARMQDIGGLRAIVSSINDVNKLASVYKLPDVFEHRLVRFDDYITTPKDDGYRSVHLVYKYKSTTVPVYNELLVELQIRTRLQHVWATAVETMSTMLGKNLKAQKGDRAWTNFFAVTSSAFAYLEHTPLVSGYKHLSRAETFKVVQRANEELRALERMRDYSKAIEWIDKQKGGWSYHLITLNSLKKQILVKSYSRDQLESATRDYNEAETRAGQGEPIEPVLVSVGPIKTLKKAYPNFFLDISGFMRVIENIIEQSKRTSLM